jgi:hypothetical protein
MKDKWHIFVVSNVFNTLPSKASSLVFTISLPTWLGSWPFTWVDAFFLVFTSPLFSLVWFQHFLLLNDPNLLVLKIHWQSCFSFKEAAICHMNTGESPTDDKRLAEEAWSRGFNYSRSGKSVCIYFFNNFHELNLPLQRLSEFLKQWWRMSN